MGALEDQRALALSVLAVPPPAELLGAPIDYFFADHFRQRTLCRLIDEISNARECDDECVRAVVRFLGDDFGKHIADEEEDLFPLLQLRGEPDDRIGDIVGQLCEEHAADRKDADAVAAGLDALLDRSGYSTALRKLLRRFAANERRHFLVENAIVLPLARARLTADDLVDLGRRMARRRGLAPRFLSGGPT